MAAITLRDVVKRFGARTALDGVSLHLADGDALGVVRHMLRRWRRREPHRRKYGRAKN